MSCAAPRNNTLCITARARGVPGANLVEPLECLHQRFQGAGADSSVQGNGEAGGVSAISPSSVIPAVMSAYGPEAVPPISAY